jgi:hypothetical protein
MRKELDTLKTEIERALEDSGFVVFHGIPRLAPPPSLVHWDTERNEDPGMFLDTARKLDVKLVVFHHRSFSREMISRAQETLENCETSRDAQREYERTLKKLSAYEGFTCSLEISFDYQNNTYLYEVMTPWYEEFLEMLDEMEDLQEGLTDDPGPLGGYYSNN